VTAVVVALALFAVPTWLLFRAFGGSNTSATAAGPDPNAVCPTTSHLDPSYVSLSGIEVASSVLDEPGTPLDQVAEVPPEGVAAFLDATSENGDRIPEDGWRAIDASPSFVTIAAPGDGQDWWYASISLVDPPSIPGWGAGPLQVTSAQRGEGLHLEWREPPTIVRNRQIDGNVWLVNDADEPWINSDFGEYWGSVHVFDPATGAELSQADSAIAGVGRDYHLEPGEAVALPLAIGELDDPEPGDYDVVACVDDLALASPVGTVHIAGSGTSDEAAQPLPSTLEITCEADGSTTVATPQIAVRSNGFGLKVRSDLEEPASLNGLGMDVDPGTTEIVTTTPPGRLDVACWPFSEHASRVEPPTVPVDVLDPDGLYVSSELECENGMGWGESIEYQDTTNGQYDDRIAAAETYVTNEELTDVFVVAGYPDQADGGPVILLRDDRVIASIGIGRADDGRWYVGGATGCDGISTN
jgi:hypothetical protein